MVKFKVGDKVRVIKSLKPDKVSIDENNIFMIGKTGVIYEIHLIHEYEYTVTIDNTNYEYNGIELQLLNDRIRKVKMEVMGK